MIEPVRARLPKPDVADRVIAPPYDALSPAQRYEFAQANPDNFLAQILSPGDGPETGGARAEGLRDFLDRFYTPPADPAYYVYEMWSADHRQRGVVGAVPVHELDSVRGHERVIEGRVQALADFYRSSGINTSPVALGFEAGPETVAAIDDVCLGGPILDHTSTGVRHRLWRSEPGRLAPWLGASAVSYITDGHHRVAAAQRGVPHHRLLVAGFPLQQLRVLGYHRVVLSTAGPEELSRLEPDWAVYRVEGPPVVGRGTVALRLRGSWYRIVRRAPRPDDVVEQLDVALCHRDIISGALGVAEADVQYLAGIDPDEIGDDAAVVMLEPPTIEEVIAVADAEKSMPPKSTWFVPKVRSGMLVVDR
jgi:uncharacterized protein (DUF1015 family)